jgi:carbamoyl-phosphate synthase large subunit
MARLIIRRVGLETGGANVQFAVNPTDGRTFVIEMNPRVSRSSALASKATGFPIAKIAALLAVGYTMDEIPNDITRKTPASFEPSLDYVVVKIPRWNFEKFKGVDPTLGPQMKAIGEVMAIGRTFPEALQKAICGLDIGMYGFGYKQDDAPPEALTVPTAQRLYQVASALDTAGYDPAIAPEIAKRTGYDVWFVEELRQIEQFRDDLIEFGIFSDQWLKAKQLGFSDAFIADLIGKDEIWVRNERKKHNVTANFYRVDTCAAEFEAFTPYLYSTYERDCDPTLGSQKVVILAAGRTGSGRASSLTIAASMPAFALQ